MAVILAYFAALILVVAGVPSMKDRVANAEGDVSLELEELRRTVGRLTRQVMLQQLFNEERIRSDADSGIKQIRHTHSGTRKYYGDTHTNTERSFSMHDHSNNIRTAGLGEFVAVLNGVEFRTRHNDYRLNMPHGTSSEWHATEPIPFPDVPPEVTNLEADDQVAEMQEWFKAWQNQNHTQRDYRNYFKPVLCYMEGAWTMEGDGSIEEPFYSDRHAIDATSWTDLQEKIRFTSYTGRKDIKENYAFLPTTIMNITEDGTPTYAQWNYRILCHPLKRDLPLNRFRVVDELHSRVPVMKTLDRFAETRAARFQLNPMDTDEWNEGEHRFGLLDELMAEIPGKDNYQGDLTDDAFDIDAMTLDSGKLNAAYYHRWFEVAQKGAMGEQRRHRGFADGNLFMALTTQPNVAGMELTTCTGPKARECRSYNEKWSYAIPLEIIYLTPLTNWNPKNVLYKGDYGTTEADTVTANRRNGGKTLEKAWDGTNSKIFYRTPDAFFSEAEVGADPADTTADSVGVLNKEGQLCIVRATGTRVHLPAIPGVSDDRIRTRYPIYPVHGEGSAVWKELEATKDVLLQSKTYSAIYREPLSSTGEGTTDAPSVPITLRTSAAKSGVTPHTHEVTVSADEVVRMKDNGEKLSFTSTTAIGHEHDLVLHWSRAKQMFDIDKCDDGASDEGPNRCWDKHGKFLSQV